ncbi:hypothetical protein HGM15179_002485, partial [Zosterops borbonicus]
VDGSVGINSKLYSPKRNRTSPEHNQPLLPSGSLCPVGVRIFSLLTIALHVSVRLTYWLSSKNDIKDLGFVMTLWEFCFPCEEERFAFMLEKRDS